MEAEHEMVTDQVSEEDSKGTCEGDLTDEYESDSSVMDLTLPKTKTTRRGLTRLPKMRTQFANSGGIKHKVTFDELGRLTGEYRSEFPSFLGDLVRQHVGFRFLTWKKVPKEVKDKLWEETTRFYDIDTCRRGKVMTRFGSLLRNFRRKVYEGYIKPNLSKPKKVGKIPSQYRSMVEQTDWDNFVSYTQSDEFKGLSEKTKQARSKNIYDHRLGRGGYAHLREIMVKNKEIAIDEIPSRALMWRKGRENKTGEYKNDEVKGKAVKLIESETQIKDGSLNLDPGTDALTVVFGKEKGGYVKGIGCGVTNSAYWQQPRTKGSSKEQIAQLQFQLHNERLEHQKKDEQIKNLSTQIAETNNALQQVLAHLAAQGQVLSICPPKQVNSEHNTNAITSKQNETQTTVNSVDNIVVSKDVTNATTSPNANTSKPVQTEMVKPRKVKKKRTTHLETASYLKSHEDTQNTDSTNVPQAYKCNLYSVSLTNRVANGTMYDSNEKQCIHGVPLQDDCYKVSVDEVIKGAAYLPIPTKEDELVEEALNHFVAWPKRLVKLDQQVPNPQFTPIATKEKKRYTTVDKLIQETRSKKKKS